MKKKLHPVFGGWRLVGLRFDHSIVGWAHYCPGCDRVHLLRAGEFQFEFRFRGEEETPTIRPAAVWQKSPSQPTVCVYTITDGKIYFGRECGHRYAGKWVPLQAWRCDDKGLPVIAPSIPTP